MDDRDFRALVHLLREPFASHETVGRDVGLSGTGVKARLDRLRESGVLRAFHGLPAAHVLGRHARIHAFEDVPDADALVDAALDVDPVVRAVHHQDGSFSVLTYAVTADAPAPPSIVERVGKDPDFVVTPRATRPEDHKSALSPIDWRVIRPLVRDPRLSIRRLADAAGVTPRTARQHRDALVAGGALEVIPLLESARARGTLLYFLRAYGKSARALGAIPDALPRCVTVRRMEDPPGVSLVCRAANLADALEDARQLRGTPGVDDVGFALTLRHRFATARVEAWVDAEIARWERARPGGI